MTKASETLLWAIVAHLVADWVFQNHWMASRKHSLRDIASWVHGGIHTLFMLIIFPWPYALGIGITHMLIDTRLPIRVWQNFFRQKTEDPYAISVAIWVDQVFHIIVLAAASLLVASD